MGGCQSSPAPAAPLKKKGQLVEAESKPYLAAQQKTPQFWVDPKELAADAEKEQNLKKKHGKADQKQKQACTAGADIDKNVHGSLSTKSTDSKDKNEAKPIKEEPSDMTPVSTTQKEEVEMKIAPKSPKKPRPSYAVIYDESVQNIKLVHWATYEKKYLPGFLADRDLFLKNIKQAKKVKKRKEAKPPSEKAHESNTATIIMPTKVSPTDVTTTKISVAAVAPTEITSASVTLTNAPSVDITTTQISPAPVASTKISPMTTIYDPDNQYVKLITWDQYVLHHQKQDTENWQIMVPQDIKLTGVLSETKFSLAQIPVEKVEPLVALYDEINQAVKLIAWELYEREHQIQDMAHWQKNRVMSTVSDDCLPQEDPEKTPMMASEEATGMVPEVTPEAVPEVAPDLVPEAAPEMVLECKEGLFFDTIQSRNVKESSEMPGPQVAMYDESTQSVKLISWELFEDQHLPEFMAIRKERELSRYYANSNCRGQKKEVVDMKLAPTGQSQPATAVDNLTTVYDPDTEGVKLISLDEYYQMNKAPKQYWSTEYDMSTQTVKLIFWKPFQPPKVSRVKTGVRATKISAKIEPLSEMTTVYDLETEGVKLIAWDEYLKTNKAPKQDWALEYNEATQSVQLAFWKPYQSKNKQKHIIPCVDTDKKSNPVMKALTELTTVYDPETEEVKLIAWDEYLKLNRVPKQDWALEYNTATQSVQLAFWKPYKPKKEQNDITICADKKSTHVMKASSEMTTVYDPETEGVKLIAWEEYLKINTVPKQDWTLEYNAVTQSVQLTFWKPYQPRNEQNNIGSCTDRKLTPIMKTSSEMTTVYDPKTEGVKLIAWDEYLKLNTVPKQDWALEYNAVTQSVQLAFWKPYQPKNDISPCTDKQLNPVKKSPCELTTVYDPETERVKLIAWDDYLKVNTVPKQDWALEYNAVTQSVQLAFWKPYQPKNEQHNISLCADKESVPIEMEDVTTIYDPETETIKLMSLEAYWSKNERPKQDWTTEYDDATQSVKLIFWKPYAPAASVASCEPSAQLCTLPPAVALTTVYNAETQSIDLIPYDEYVKSHEVPKQDYAAIYDDVSQSVKLIFWKDYQQSLQKSIATEAGCESRVEPPETPLSGSQEGFAAMYNETEQSVELIDWELYEADHLPDIICQRNKLFPSLSHEERIPF